MLGLGDFIALGNAIKSLVDGKAEFNEKYFDDFINPAWESFKESHDKYKESFESYEEMLLEDNFRLEILLEKITKEDRSSADVRSDLESMIKKLPSKGMKNKEVKLLEFVNSIKAYFDYQGFLASAFNLESNNLVFRSGEISYKLQDSTLAKSLVDKLFPDFSIPPTVARSAFHEWLSKNQNLNKKNVKQAIEFILKEIQNRYAHVADAYQDLKTELKI